MRRRRKKGNFFRMHLNAAANWRGFRVTLSNCETRIREQKNDAIKVKKKFFSVSEILRRNVSVT